MVFNVVFYVAGGMLSTRAKLTEPEGGAPPPPPQASGMSPETGDGVSDLTSSSAWLEGRKRKLHFADPTPAVRVWDAIQQEAPARNKAAK